MHRRYRFFRFVGNASVCGGITDVASLLEGSRISHSRMGLSHGSLAWTSLDSHGSQLSRSSLGTAVICTCVLCGSICVCWPTTYPLSNIIIRIFVSTPTSALQPLAVHSLAHLSTVSQTISTTYSSDDVDWCLVHSGTSCDPCTILFGAAGIFISVVGRYNSERGGKEAREMHT